MPGDLPAEPAAEHVFIPADGARLAGMLTVPRECRGVVAFAHGSGSGRHSPRNQVVASVLQQSGLATLLIDLLTEGEARDRSRVFDIELLADRLGAAAVWLGQDNRTRTLPLGLFGASTGAAAALVVAARTPQVAAVVSRGGRPDLAGHALADVQAPTLLIVGGNDTAVIALNEQARGALRCPTELVIIPGATHLFPEPGALEEVARLAAEWLRRFLAGD